MIHEKRQQHVYFYNSSSIKKHIMIIHSTFSIPVTLTIDYTDCNRTYAHIFGLVLHNYWTKFEDDAGLCTCRGSAKMPACVNACNNWLRSGSPFDAISICLVEQFKYTLMQSSTNQTHYTINWLVMLEKKSLWLLLMVPQSVPLHNICTNYGSILYSCHKCIIWYYHKSGNFCVWKYSC